MLLVFFFASSFFCLFVFFYVCKCSFCLLTVCMCLCVRVCVCVCLLFFVEFLFCLRLSFSFFFVCLFVLFSYVVLFEFPPISSFLGFPLSAFSYQVDVFQLFFFSLLFNSVLYQSLNMYRFNSQIGLVAVAKGPLLVCFCSSQQLKCSVQCGFVFFSPFSFFVLYGVCFCFTVCVFECVSLNTYGGSSTCCLGVVVAAVLLFARVQESESFVSLFSDSSVFFCFASRYVYFCFNLSGFLFSLKLTW